MCFSHFRHSMLLKGTSPRSTSTVIAITPLIALMKDQVASLSTRGLVVGCITHERSDEERVKVKDSPYQLVYSVQKLC